jgi:hypothetical protein
MVLQKVKKSGLNNLPPNWLKNGKYTLSKAASWQLFDPLVNTVVQFSEILLTVF